MGVAVDVVAGDGVAFLGYRGAVLILNNDVEFRSVRCVVYITLFVENESASEAPARRLVLGVSTARAYDPKLDQIPSWLRVSINSEFVVADCKKCC
ncbi:hypothetical protein ACROYT_G037019 [Oculina patagonica]